MAVWTILALFATHVLGGVAAFGSTLLALPLLLLLGWDLRAAVALLATVGLVQAVHVSCLTWRGADRRALVRILVVAGLGIPLGFLAAGHLPERGLGVLLGVLLAAAGGSRLVEHCRRTTWRPPGWVLYTLLLAGGVIHGAFASGGATLTIYGRYALRHKAVFRGTLALMWVILNTVVVIGLAFEGRFDRGLAAVLLPAIPVVLLATWCGDRLARRLSQERFVDLVAALLCLAGILTIVRNLT